MIQVGDQVIVDFFLGDSEGFEKDLCIVIGRFVTKNRGMLYDVLSPIRGVRKFIPDYYVVKVDDAFSR